ncbi:hypothetical protein BU24DRAFT_115661 [Aaosphaeria arxii CBS 175.79]|uniref:Uncharacterized protein n=1 Tax=Aaosphaeria arxii CBS 175.79 TaxID=1450172 RepID=A0A6A5Y210_9PLEO|nr:uncharacterized protein BU24DRAFT_115661 [Aaosphaeria arxii CBS 175.79]KAF2019259.1 hypothetical protein BU24DRAFT_115661 [Aaosphaeria arxii CBS 175.79]
MYVQMYVQIHRRACSYRTRRAPPYIRRRVVTPSIHLQSSIAGRNLTNASGANTWSRIVSSRHSSCAFLFFCISFSVICSKGRDFDWPCIHARDTCSPVGHKEDSIPEPRCKTYVRTYRSSQVSPICR